MAETKKYWKGIEELEQTPEFVESTRKEFTDYVPVDEFLSNAEEDSSETSRRDFLKVLGFSVTAATLAACEAPVTKSIPFLNKPEEITPGVADYYSSTFFDGYDMASVRIKTREGRPIFVQGNLASPFSGGGINARINCSVLGLYDSKRAKGPAIKVGNSWAKNASWERVDKDVKKSIRNVSSLGKKVALLTNTVISPVGLNAINSFAASIGAQGGLFDHVTYDAISASGILDANHKSFGKRVIPTYNFHKAKTVVSFAADFLGNWLNALQYTKGFTTNRNPDNDWMVKHYQFETTLSVSGAAADVRASMKPSVIVEAVKFLYGEIGGNTKGVVPPKVASKLKKAAKKLLETKGESLVVCGSNNGGLQVLINAINEKLNNYGSTIEIDKEVYVRQGDDVAFASLVEEMNNNEIGALIITGLNPSYVAPASLKFNEALKNVDTVIYTGERFDETSDHADYFAPNSHFLESWDVLNPSKGDYGFVQPTINPLFKTRQWQESLLKWSGDNQDFHNYFKSTGISILGSETALIDAIHDGYVSISQTESLRSSAIKIEDLSDSVNDSDSISTDIILNAIKQSSTKVSGDYELELYVKTGLGNGEYAFNPWLHEMPDPISMMTYDNYISMNPADVMKLLNLEDTTGNRRSALYIGQESPAKVAQVTVGGQSVKLPVVPQPGQARGTLAIALGYGRKGTENFTREEWLGDLFDSENKKNNTIGKNVFPLQEQDLWMSNTISSGVSIELMEGVSYPMATTQTHNTMMGRKLVNEVDFETYKEQKGKAKEKGGYNEALLIADSYGEKKTTRELDLWEEQAIDLGHRWGISVDLNLCTGCGACITACHIENNVPLVGKDEVRRSREMHWMRIDRYYSSHIEIDGESELVDELDDLNTIKDYLDAEVSDSDDNVRVSYMPVMCQHCNHAPCETVCPVAATTHSDEGWNQMTYNRCVGTRYCANNCPYKVRRFNWFQYDDLNIPAFPDFAKVNYAQDDLGRMVLNPDVVVRSRGVMEKCSMCVQSIQAGKLKAKKAGRLVEESDIDAACSSICPAECITFGDLNDTNHRVNKMKDDDRSYLLMEEIGAQPNVYYQTLVRNVEKEKII
jgi:molybdopterin-containing oxidoreductase family iron-sulfur binding subunit